MILVVAALCVLSENVFSMPLDEYEKNLTAHLKKYVTVNSPSPGMENKSVYCIVDLYQIISVEEKNNILNAKLWMYCYYKIPAMEWDPEDYGGIRTLIFKEDTFWTPDIEVNSMTSNEFQSSTSQYVMFDGGLVLPIATSINAKLSCKFDVTNFPLDEHTCILELSQWVSKIDDYRLRYPELPNGESAMALLNYVRHDQWDLLRPVEMEARCAKFAGTFYDQHIYKIRIRRSPDFHLRVLVYPTLVIYGISTFSFYLPFESGEKVSLSITILLAQVVNLLGLSDNIPASSVNFPVFGKFVLVNIVLVGFTVLVSVITLNMYHKNTSSVPPQFLRKLPYTRIAWFVGVTKLSDSCNAVKSIKKVETDHTNSISPNDELLSDVNEIEEMMCAPEINENTKEEWQLIALVIDHICGFVYIIAGIVVFLLYNPLQLSF